MTYMCVYIYIYIYIILLYCFFSTFEWVFTSENCATLNRFIYYFYYYVCSEHVTSTCHIGCHGL